MRAGIASTDLRFTIADPEAWQQLSTGLTFTGSIALGTLYLQHSDRAGWDHWTPMTVRDANGAVHTAVPSLSGGVLTLTLDQAVIDSAAYPLTLTTRATVHRNDVNEWGAVTSAFPKLNAFRGDGGLDQPYFEAAGQGADAVVGSYCDALADADCGAQHEAAVYWKFWSAPSIGVPRPASSVGFKESRRVFSVDAADPSADGLDDASGNVLHETACQRRMPGGRSGIRHHRVQRLRYLQHVRR